MAQRCLSRPATLHRSGKFAFKLIPLAVLDAWIARQKGEVSRPEAILRLVKKGLRRREFTASLHKSRPETDARKMDLQLLTVGETPIVVYALIPILIGFVVALVMRRNSDWSLRRMPYFVGIALTIMLSATSAYLWLLIPEAMASHQVWILVAVFSVILLLIGGIHGALAAARSLKAYGDRSKAWFAIVPGANPCYSLHSLPSRAATTKRARNCFETSWACF